LENGHYGAEATMNATRVGRKSMTETSITAWLSNTSTSSILLMRSLWQPKELYKWQQSQYQINS